jgi:hypothetical protein
VFTESRGTANDSTTTQLAGSAENNKQKRMQTEISFIGFDITTISRFREILLQEAPNELHKARVSAEYEIRKGCLVRAAFSILDL